MGSFHEYTTCPTFVVATSCGENTHQPPKFLCLDFDDLGELVNMDALGVIHQDIGDVLSESDPDASIIVYLHELPMIGVSVGVIGKDHNAH